MPTGFNLIGLGSFLLPSLVVSLVWIAGALYATVTFSRHRAVSLTALIGCCVLLVNSLGGGVVTYWLIQQQFSRGWSSGNVSLYMSVVNVMRTGLSVVGYALLLVAVFGWRSVPVHRPQRRELEPDRPPPSTEQGDPAGIRKAGRTF